MRVVADTNILVSALQFGGKPKQLLETFDRSPEWLTEADRQLRVIIRLVETTERLRVIGADPSDDRIPECAAAGRADVIVSGDVHCSAAERDTPSPANTPTGRTNCLSRSAR